MIIFTAKAGSAWTKDESALAHEMHKAGHSWDEIGHRLDRTGKAVQNHISLCRLGPVKAREYAEKRNEKRRIDRRDYLPTERHLDCANAEIYRPSPEMLEDRYKRALLPPRDLTAVLMGDPPVGLSALERRA